MYVTFGDFKIIVSRCDQFSNWTFPERVIIRTGHFLKCMFQDTAVLKSSRFQKWFFTKWVMPKWALLEVDILCS
jgi:hypothetical protein